MGKPFNKGDIVKLKLLSKNEYYIITDVSGVAFEEDLISTEYDMTLIFPIKDDIREEIVIHELLEIVAKYETAEHSTLIEFIMRERLKKNLSLLPNKVDDILYGIDIEKHTEEEVEEEMNQHESDNHFKQFVDAKSVESMMDDTTSEEKIKFNLERMNMHLDLLHQAIEEMDNLHTERTVEEIQEMIDYNKNELKEIRQTLVELEYFPYKAKRR